MWSLSQYADLFVRAGYRNLSDLIELHEKDVRALGVSKDADVRRMMQLVSRLRSEHSSMMMQMDALYIDPDMVDMKTWLEKRGLDEFLKAFEKHRIDFEVLGDISYEDLNELGIKEVGPRRKVLPPRTTIRSMPPYPTHPSRCLSPAPHCPLIASSGLPRHHALA